jgi:hypothetical protein
MSRRRAWLPPRNGGYSAVESQSGKPADKSRESKPTPPKGRAGVSKSDRDKEGRD